MSEDSGCVGEQYVGRQEAQAHRKPEAKNSAGTALAVADRRRLVRAASAAVIPRRELCLPDGRSKPNEIEHILLDKFIEGLHNDLAKLRDSRNKIPEEGLSEMMGLIEEVAVYLSKQQNILDAGLGGNSIWTRLMALFNVEKRKLLAEKKEIDKFNQELAPVKAELHEAVKQANEAKIRVEKAASEKARQEETERVEKEKRKLAMAEAEKSESAIKTSRETHKTKIEKILAKKAASKKASQEEAERVEEEKRKLAMAEVEKRALQTAERVEAETRQALEEAEKRKLAMAEAEKRALQEAAELVRIRVQNAVAKQTKKDPSERAQIDPDDEDLQRQAELELNEDPSYQNLCSKSQELADKTSRISRDWGVNGIVYKQLLARSIQIKEKNTDPYQVSIKHKYGYTYFDALQALGASCTLQPNRPMNFDNFQSAIIEMDGITNDIGNAIKANEAAKKAILEAKKEEIRKRRTPGIVPLTRLQRRSKLGIHR